MRFVFCVVLLLAVSACAPTLPPGDMMPMTQVYSQIPVNEELQRNIKLGDVAVAENVGGMTAPVRGQLTKGKKSYAKGCWFRFS